MYSTVGKDTGYISLDTDKPTNIFLKGKFMNVFIPELGRQTDIFKNRDGQTPILE